VLVEVRAVTINTSDFLYIRGVGDRRVQNRCAVAAMGET
jgi:NADPH:quinone reductase-like Zn-dependent oxidoreductase